MASTQCDYPGCPEPVTLKCGGCGKVYCVLHIRRTGPIDTCDVCIAEKEAEAKRERAERAKEAAIKRAETAEALARLKADMPRREANRKIRVRLAWIGTSMIVSSILLTWILGSLGFLTSFNQQPLPWIVIEVLFWGGDHHTISQMGISRLKRPPFSYPSQLLMRIQWCEWPS